ncbi:hypothetical protein SCALM49S_09108 [Streptomyces californicus]
MRWTTLSPPSPMKMLRFCTESTPTMKSTDIVRVRHPSISAVADSSVIAYTTSNQTVLSDHMRTENASLPSVSRRASSQCHGLSGPYSSWRFGTSRTRKNR